MMNPFVLFRLAAKRFYRKHHVVVVGAAAIYRHVVILYHKLPIKWDGSSIFIRLVEEAPQDLCCATRCPRRWDDRFQDAAAGH